MKVVVCDNGSGSVKCGFAGANAPEAVIPTVVGRPLNRAEDSSAEALPDLMVGAPCFEYRQHLKLSYPISNGIVQKWEDMGHVWDHVFKDVLRIKYHFSMRLDQRKTEIWRNHWEKKFGEIQVRMCFEVDPSETRILLTDPPMSGSGYRQKLVETMFEKYGFNSLFIQSQAVLPLYAQGILTGLVIDSGESVTHAVPVVEGYAYTHLTKRLNIAGRQITSHLIDLLVKRGYLLSSTGDADLMRTVKEKLCYVSCDLEREQRLAEETTVLVKKYTLPDGRFIKVGAERFQAPEALFNPELVDREEDGLADVVFRTIQETDIDHRMSLYQHIMLSGGTTMFPGLPSRLEKEIRDRYLKNVLKGNKEGLKKLKLRIDDPPNRRNLVFIGGAVLADIMRDKPDFWISKAEYQEEGVRCLKKCEG